MTEAFDAAGSAGPLLTASEIGVKASWGHIYGPTSVTVPRGGVTVVKGSGGRGRTALLLTLCGRMRPTSGTLVSFDRTNDAKTLYKRSAIGFIEEVDGIVQTVSVRDVLTEQLRWNSPWYKWVPVATDADLERICRPTFGPQLQLPPLNSFVEELPELTAALFQIAVANMHRPELLVVGGIDKMHRHTNSQVLLNRLIELGREQTVITADVNGAPGFEDYVTIAEVSNLTDGSFADLDRVDRSA